MASVQRDAGFSKPALANWSRAIEIWEQLWAENPSDVPLADLVVAHSFRVLVKNQTGDEEGAAADTRRAETIFEQVKEVCSRTRRTPCLMRLRGCTIAARTWANASKPSLFIADCHQEPRGSEWTSHFALYRNMASTRHSPSGPFGEHSKTAEISSTFRGTR